MRYLLSTAATAAIRYGRGIRAVKPQAMSANRTSYQLTLRPEPGNWLVSPEQRLRAGLKRLLRNHGLRCLSCKPIEAPAAPNTHEDTAAPAGLPATKLARALGGFPRHQVRPPNPSRSQTP